MASVSNRGLKKKKKINTNFKISLPSNWSIKRLRKTIERINQYRADPFGIVINILKFSFTKYQYKLLNKNLNFCPTPERYNKNEVINNLKEFKRKIKLIKLRKKNIAPKKVDGNLTKMITW